MGHGGAVISRGVSGFAAVAGGAATALLYVVAFPPFNLAEAAYIFAVPLLGYSLVRPSMVAYGAAVFGSSWLSWIVLIWWLRHVTFFGMLLLTLILGLFTAVWYLAAGKVLPAMLERSLGLRLAGMAGLAGSWVLLEFLRGVLFTGFPWLPLAASQWNRSALLQIISYTGQYGASFVLIFFNLGCVIYIRHLVQRRAGAEWWERICWEFYTSLFLLLGVVAFMLWPGFFQPDRQQLFRVAIVQPYVNQPEKWDPASAERIMNTLERQTLLLHSLGSDLIVWPESVTPWPIRGDERMRTWTEDLAARLGQPILMGNMAVEGKFWYNIVCLVSPVLGLIEPYYAKRKLVPFGEYVPLGKWLPFVRKVVPIEGDFAPGKGAPTIPLKVGDRTLRVGALICYEDVFPHLALESVRSGADFLFVATNDAWYGEEGAAHQHAAHSVLRAVETRRPVLRSGNAGWSGWIDEYGNIRQLLVDSRGSIYFRGGAVVELSRDSKWALRASFYVRYGDWFLLICLAFLAIAALLFRFSPA